MTGIIKDRKGMDLTEAEDIKKTWQEYTEELYKKDLNDLDEIEREELKSWLKTQHSKNKDHGI